MDIFSLKNTHICDFIKEPLDCTCGGRHTFSTEKIVFKRGAINELDAFTARFVPSLSSVLLLTDETVRGHTARAFEKRLIRAGYRLQVHTFEATPQGLLEEAHAVCKREDCKWVLGVGGGTLADITKYIAAKEGLPAAFVLTSPSAVRVLSPSAMLFKDGVEETYKTPAFAGVFCDVDFLPVNSDACLAGAFGELISKYISLFDYQAAHIIAKEPFCADILRLGTWILDDILKTFGITLGRLPSESFLKNPIQTDDTASLTHAALKFGALNQLINSSRLVGGSETQTAHVARILFKHEERPVLRRGELEFLFARVVQCIYQRYLGKRTQFFISPPDNNMRLERIGEFLGVDERIASKKIRLILESKTNELHTYRLNEYRTELFSACALNTAKFTQAYKIFKRLYSDDGYSLQNALDSSDTALAVSLGPDLKDKFTLLSHMKDMGLLDEYVKELI